MTAPGPELRRAVAEAVLCGVLGREPTAAEVAHALHRSGEVADVAALARHVAATLHPRLVTGPQAERAALEQALAAAQASLRDATAGLAAAQAELAALRGSSSWRMTGPVRAVASRLPVAPARAAAARLRGPRAASPDNAAPPGLTLDPAANAAVWCTRGAPVVSIVVRHDGDGAATADCVRAVWAHTSGVPYEIVIADASSDGLDPRLLDPPCDGVRTIRLGTSRFAGEANNIAAEAARGEFVCLLSTAVRVRDGWLAALYAMMRDDPVVGASGPVLLDAAGHAAPQPRPVQEPEALPGAALLVDLAAYLSVGGFDLAYEPGGMGARDLCFKLRLIGRSIRLCPTAEVVRLAPPAPDVEAAERHAAIEAVNRGKFLARWGRWLQDPSPAVAEALRAELIPPDPLPPGPARAARRAGLPQAVIFTPFQLTPGGGERVILTLAAVLSRTHRVEIVTVHPYSRVRLAGLGHEFAIDLSACTLATLEDRRRQPPAALWVTLGNHVFPPIAGGGQRNWYICQFPFPMDAATEAAERRNLGGYDLVLTYSEYARAHVRAAMRAAVAADLPTEVLYPPVMLPAGDAAVKRPAILSVGRFIAGGHTKRHDALIDAFRMLHHRRGGGVEYHIVGSSFPAPQDMAYLAALRDAASDLPVTFHVNAQKHTLGALFRDAAVYWHATGYGSDAAAAPERAEHFGISIVEAMAAGGVPLAFAAGGPCEIIRDGETGFLFRTLDELVDRTEALLAPDRQAERATIGRAAADAARRFSLEPFVERIDRLLAVHVRSVAP